MAWSHRQSAETSGDLRVPAGSITDPTVAAGAVKRRFSLWDDATKNRILDLWEAGKGSSEIVEILGLPERGGTSAIARVGMFVGHARALGDPRAVRRQKHYARFG